MVFALRKLSVRRFLPLFALVPLTLILTGCPGDALSSAGAPGMSLLSSTAPAIGAEHRTAISEARSPELTSSEPTPSAPAQVQPPQAPPTQTPQEIAAAQQHAQAVQNLINRAQASYNSGVNNYNNNNLDAARHDFDAAVDMMLSSGMDLKNDPQLSDAFEHLLDSINSLEIVALKQGNGFSPKVEEPPLEEAEAEVTFAPDPALLSRVNAELKTTKSDLPLVVNDYVGGFINYFSNNANGHAHLVHSLERAGKYKEMIARDLASAGVPQDLIYIAVAESGFQPQVVNRSSGAGGMWQFMPFQGAYGLERNGYFDERFDPEKSSLAFARYMKYLYSQLGDWYLAIAAYDWGPGNIQRAVQRTGYADFWELYRLNALPRETKDYVPAMIAAAIMAKNPQQYGLTGLVPDAPVVSDTVPIDYAINLQLVADLTNATVSEIVALNPALLRLTTPSDIPYDLHLPAGTKDTYLTRLKDIPEEDRATWRFHVVRPGETLDEIAATYHAHLDSLAEYNDVTAAKPIEVGDELVVPISAPSARPGQQRYTVRRSDTLVTVADRFGVTVEQLREWNNRIGNRLTPGRSIYVAEPLRLAPSVRGHRGRLRRASFAKTKSGARNARSSRASRTLYDPPSSRRASSRRGASLHASSRAGAPSSHHSSSHTSSSSSRKRRR